MATQTIKRGVENPKVSDILKDANGPVDLTGRTIYLVLRAHAAAAPALTKLATVDGDQEANKGRVEVSLAPESVDMALGEYRKEWQHWTGGTLAAVYPSGTYDAVELIDPLNSEDPGA